MGQSMQGLMFQGSFTHMSGGWWAHWSNEGLPDMPGTRPDVSWNICQGAFIIRLGRKRSPQAGEGTPIHECFSYACCVTYANAPLAKANLVAKPRFKRQRNKPHFLTERAVRSRCRGVCTSQASLETEPAELEIHRTGQPAGSSARFLCVSQEGILLWEISVFALRPSTNWMRLICIMKGNLFYIK